MVGTETGMFVKWWDGGTFREQQKGRAGIGQKNSELCEPQRRAEGGQHDEPQSLLVPQYRGRKTRKGQVQFLLYYRPPYSGAFAFFFLFFSFHPLFAFLYWGGCSLGPWLASLLSHPFSTLTTTCIANSSD